MKIIIDGRSFEVSGEETVLEAAKAHGIDIPALCHHPRLAPWAACRLCVVEIKGRNGYPPSCNTYPEEGMEVVTDSEALRSQRRRTLELILSEHPNACLVCTEKERCDEHKASIRKSAEVAGCVFCPSNRRCELQKLVDRLGVDSVPYDSVYRGLPVRRSDPFFIQDYNLCILCGRCVRVCHEVRGAAAISFVFRGSQAVVGTQFDRSLIAAGCQFCGACVDVCPTGSLAERLARHEEPAEAKSRAVCPYCGVGCGLEVSVLQGRIQSAAPADGGINRGQACVRGRFTLRDVVHSPARVLKPMIKKDGKLAEVSWDEALDFAARGLKARAGKTGLTASSQLFCEDLFVLDRFGREALGCGGATPSAGVSILDELSAGGMTGRVLGSLKSLPEAGTIVVFDEPVSLTHPVAWVSAFEAVRKGAKLILAGAASGPMSRHASLCVGLKPGGLPHLIAAVSKALLEKGCAGAASVPGFEAFKKSLESACVSRLAEAAGAAEADVRGLADALAGGGPIVFLFGGNLVGLPRPLQGVALLWNLAVQTGATLLPLAEESDTAGSWLIRSRAKSPAPSLSALSESLGKGDLKALYLAGPMTLPEKHGLEFLVVQDSFLNAACAWADAVLPAAAFAEAEGHFVNLEGSVRKSERAVPPAGESKPDWWIASELAKRMGAPGFSYENAGQIKAQLDKEGVLALPAPGVSGAGVPPPVGTGSGLPAEGKKAFVPASLPAPCVSGDSPEHAEAPVSGEQGSDHYRSLSLCHASPDLALLRRSRRTGEARPAAKTAETVTAGGRQ
ncbi:MAG: molybdopterin-dependent oxidoreductase [Elusimicrobia bacterium]|nr:molybdopterin-dependent oxidoreductase [Elusimicrobiota bacterium]